MNYVFDIEADGLLNEASRVWCIVLYDLDTKVSTTYTNEKEGYPRLSAALDLMEKADSLIGHNIYSYDLPLLKKLKGFTYNGKITDTLILSQLLNFSRKGGHGLASWGENLGVAKPVQEQWLFFEERMLNRCEMDVKINVKTLMTLRKEFKQAKIPASVITTEFETARISAQQVENGWLVDTELAEGHFTWLNQEIEALASKITPLLPPNVKRLDSIGKVVAPKYTKKGDLHAHIVKYFEGFECIDYTNEHKLKVYGSYCRVKVIPIEMTQHALIKDFLLSQGWVPTEWNMKMNEEGKKERTSPKLTEDSFDTIKGDLGKDIALHMVYSHRRNMLRSVKNDKTGWLNTLRDDNRLECIPMTLGAATGRMRHKNLVNVPGGHATFGEELRSIFIAPKGKVLVGCDLASAQLRLLAAAMGDDDYNKTVTEGKEEEGTDIHSVNAKIAGLLDPDGKPNRKMAKTFIYGFLFGAGDAKTASDLGIKTKEAKELKAKFLKGLPALSNLKNYLDNQFEHTGGKYIVAQDGRKILCNSKHKLLNYLLQGNEAILTKNWMVLADKRIKEANIDCKLLAVMHDEMNFECSPDRADELAKILEVAATDAGNALKFKCRMDGNSKIGNNWMDIH